MIGHGGEGRSLLSHCKITLRSQSRSIRARPHLGVAATAVVLLLGCTEAQAGEKGEKEAIAIIELGGAAETAFTGETGFGPSVAVEFEPIKDWLEIEIGTGPLFGKGQSHWDTDVLFKKPFTLSDKVEFMIGGGGAPGAEFALDFMIWPTKDRKFGWFVEPTYSYSLGSEHEQSLGVSVGLLIPIQPN
jgi:hypothetical protein